MPSRPRHRGLLLAAASGFTQYAYAFVHQDADEREDEDWEASGRKFRETREGDGKQGAGESGSGSERYDNW